MPVELVTGSAGGTAHIGSADFGRLNALAYGTGAYIMAGLGDDELAASMTTSNTLRAGSANIMAQGRHIYVDPEGIEWTIQNGMQGQKRIDLCVLQYVKDDETEVESVSPLTIKGTPSADSPVAPVCVDGDILNGKALEAHIPAFTVALDGLSVSTPTPLLSKRELPTDGVSPVSRGGTGATTGKAACANLGAFAGNAGGLDDVTPATLYTVAPGAYLIGPTATGSPCPGQYGNAVISRSGGNRTFAVATFDGGESYILNGYTNGGVVASWDRIDNEISYVTAICGTQTSIAASRKEIPLNTLKYSYGSAITLSSNRIVCNKAGAVLVSGAMYIKATGNCDNVQIGLAGCSRGSLDILDRNATVANGDDHSVPIPAKVLEVEAGDKLYWHAANWAGARGYVAAGDLSYLNAVYLGRCPK